MDGQQDDRVPLSSTITNMNWVNRKLACKKCGQPLFQPQPGDAPSGEPVDYNYLTQEQMAFVGLVCANLNCPTYFFRILESKGNKPAGQE